jgi:hypothetical protein
MPHYKEARNPRLHVKLTSLVPASSVRFDQEILTLFLWLPILKLMSAMRDLMGEGDLLMAAHLLKGERIFVHTVTKDSRWDRCHQNKSAVLDD